MKRDVFTKLIKEEILPKCFKIMKSKGMSYSGVYIDDKLANFKRVASETGLTPLQVWNVYFLKHKDAISSYIRGEYNDSESIEGRIQDGINYLFLLYGLIKEEKEKDL